MQIQMLSSRLALSLALSLGGTAALALPAGTAAAQEAASATDLAITARIKAALLADARTQGFDVNVDTRGGAVTLTGGADSQDAKDAAGAIAMGVDGVSRVDNRLVVAAPGTQAREAANQATASGEVRAAAAEAGDAMQDGWLSTKVKAGLIADERVKAFDIDVTTEGDVVRLSGHVPSQEVRAVAIGIAEGTEGVARVDASALEVH